MENNPKATIMVVDDDPIILSVVERILTHHGYRVRCADNGHTALELCLDTDRPDLVILDYGMPKIDGVEVAKKLRALTSIPVIFLTQYREAQIGDLVAKAGAFSFLTKPLNSEELLGNVKAALQRSSERETLLEIAEREGRVAKKHEYTFLARGMLMAQFGITKQEAATLMRHFARSLRRPVLNVCEELVNNSASKPAIAKKMTDFEKIHQEIRAKRANNS